MHDGRPLRGDVPRRRSQAPQRQRGARHAMVWPRVVAEVHHRARREALRQVQHGREDTMGIAFCMPYSYGHHIAHIPAF